MSAAALRDALARFIEQTPESNAAIVDAVLLYRAHGLEHLQVGLVIDLQRLLHFDGCGAARSLGPTLTDAQRCARTRSCCASATSSCSAW